MEENKNSSKKNKKKPKVSIMVKSISGIVMLLLVYSVIVSIMGFNNMTDALLEQYSDGAFRTADTAVMELDVSKIDEYAASGGTTEEYLEALESMERLCNSTGSTFIYVIRPDLTDYKHITFLFSTINENSEYSRYEFGFVRDTTNEDYMGKYRKLYEGESQRELVIRDEGYIETDPHITAMVPIKDADGNTTAILCVQRQMDNLVNVRNTYVKKIIIVMFILMILVITTMIIYLNCFLLHPVTKITEEASRFSNENKMPDKRLSDIVRNKDEIGVLAASIDSMEERIVNYVEDLTKVTAERERISTELDLATRIQASMLPTVFPPYPDKTEFDIYASMDPAKAVGGDFYDFFLIDDDHLCVVMADVSGKGIPAALFMMASKIILSNYAKMGKTPSEILTAANESICANNQEDMFVTVWLGILELSTGKMTAANAGHEYPVIMNSEGRFEIYKDKHGFVIGGMPGFKFKEYTFDMKPGDKLFLYTDGVPEATNSEMQLFGTERMLDVLNEIADGSCEDILKGVRKGVDAFVKNAEQFDDLTMLCLEYKG